MNPFGVPFVMDCALPADELRARLRSMVERRLFPKTLRFRLLQLRGWVLEERDGEFLLRTGDWSVRGTYGARFVGRIEPMDAGSRIVGDVVEHWLTGVIMTVWLLVVATTALAWFIQHAPDVKSTLLVALMIAGAVGMVHLDLRMTARTVRDGIAYALSN
jgi:hypothetical protein